MIALGLSSVVSRSAVIFIKAAKPITLNCHFMTFVRFACWGLLVAWPRQQVEAVGDEVFLELLRALGVGIVVDVVAVGAVLAAIVGKDVASSLCVVAVVALAVSVGVEHYVRKLCLALESVFNTGEFLVYYLFACFAFALLPFAIASGVALLHYVCRV